MGRLNVPAGRLTSGFNVSAAGFGGGASNRGVLSSWYRMNSFRTVSCNSIARCRNGNPSGARSQTSSSAKLIAPNISRERHVQAMAALDDVHEPRRVEARVLPRGRSDYIGKTKNLDVTAAKLVDTHRRFIEFARQHLACHEELYLQGDDHVTILQCQKWGEAAVSDDLAVDLYVDYLKEFHGVTDFGLQLQLIILAARGSDLPS
jgi:hypothetical protein